MMRGRPFLVDDPFTKSMPIQNSTNIRSMTEQRSSHTRRGRAKHTLTFLGALVVILTPVVAQPNPTVAFDVRVFPRPSPAPSTSPENSSFPSPVWTSTDSHTSAKTQTQSQNPSSVPTLFPSHTSTQMPSTRPYESTSNQSSQFPSNHPSASPTLECHDQATYRSPINDLTCEDHRGTNCASWRVLGLNTTELGALVEQCPQSCQVPCGYFLQFTISIGLIIIKVPGLMDHEANSGFHKATVQYLARFARSRLQEGVALEIDSVAVLSQTVISDTPNRHERVRRAQAVNALPSVSLSVGLEITGFAIGVPNERVSKLFLEGVDDESFTAALRATDEFFSESEVSSLGRWSSRPVLTPHEKRHETFSPTEITLSITFGVLFSLGVTWYWTYHRPSAKRLQGICSCSPSGIDVSFVVNSPLRYNDEGALSLVSASPGIPAPSSNSRSLTSFDDSRASTHRAGNGTTLMRVLANLSICRSRSSIDVDDDEQQSAESTDANEEHEGVDSRLEKHDDKLSEHPLSHIIPPMIVVDIDEHPNQGKSRDAARVPQQVPGLTLHASKDLLAMLRGGKDFIPEDMVSPASGERNQDGSSFHYWQGTDNLHHFSPIGLIMDFDSDIECEASVASSPVLSPGPRPPLYHRRAVSMGASKVRRAESAVMRSSIFTSPTSKGHITQGSNPKSDVKRGKHFEKSLLFASQSTIGIPASTLRRAISSEALRDGSNVYKIAIGGQAPSPLSAVSRSLSFGSSPPKTPNKKSVARGVIDPSSLTAGANEAHEDNDHKSNMMRLEFQVPRNDQLGLVLDADGSSITIHAVKDSSSLLGLVQPGDKIVEVDHIDTTSCTMTDMTRLLLATKPSCITTSGSYHSAHQSVDHRKLAVLRSQADLKLRRRNLRGKRSW